MVQPNIMQDRLQELFPVHYRNGNILMINADCMEVMKHIQDNEVELSCVDPPYGIGVDGQKESISTNRFHHDFKGWDTAIPDKEYFIELFRVSENQIIWGGNYMVENLKNSRCWLIWDKIQEFSGADFEMAWTSFNKSAKAYRMSRVEAYTNQDKIHPTQKPVALYKWLLSRYAKPGDKILDTHGGSGSICIACHDLGYDLTWMELDKDYYEAACKRYKNHASQATLFDPVELTKLAEQPTPDLFQ